MDEYTYPLVVEVKGKVVGYSTIHVSRGRSRHKGYLGFSLDPEHVKPAAKPLLQATIDIGKRLNLVELFTEILDESDELGKLVRISDSKPKPPCARVNLQISNYTYILTHNVCLETIR